MTAFRSLALLVTLIFVSACSPTKGYQGPDRPDSEIALVTYSSDPSGEVSDASVNGIGYGGAGIKLLPGKHQFSMRFTLKDRPDHCYSFPDFNHYEYSQCKDKKNGACDCYDFLDIREKCFYRAYDGYCDGKVKVKAGRSYVIQLRRYGKGADVSVSGDAGDGKCSVEGSREAEEENYVGSGRYTANSRGIYSCY